MPIGVKPFGVTRQGREVTCLSLCNSNGMSVDFLDFGCTIRAINVPDYSGTPTDVVLGYDNLDEYERGSSCFGAFVGRYANRIKDAAFILDGKLYSLLPNDGANHLHGTFPKQVFGYKIDQANNAITLSIESPDGDDGFPASLGVQVRYSLTQTNTLVMEYTARASRATVINLTNHSYFNLAGQGNGDILDHIVRLDCDRFTESDSQLLPTGRILSARNTPLDFGFPRTVGAAIKDAMLRVSAGIGSAVDKQILEYNGFDHNLIFADGIIHRGNVFCPRSGIRLDFCTTQPAVQLYTANSVQNDAVGHGKGGVCYPCHAALCIETQHYPCSPNYPLFPSTVLRPNELYHERTEFTFSANSDESNAT